MQSKRLMRFGMTGCHEQGGQQSMTSLRDYLLPCLSTSLLGLSTLLVKPLPADLQFKQSRLSATRLCTSAALVCCCSCSLCPRELFDNLFAHVLCMLSGTLTTAQEEAKAYQASGANNQPQSPCRAANFVLNDADYFMYNTSAFS